MPDFNIDNRVVWSAGPHYSMDEDFKRTLPVAIEVKCSMSFFMIYDLEIEREKRLLIRVLYPALDKYISVLRKRALGM